MKENGNVDGPYTLKKGPDGKFVYNEYAEWWKNSLAKYQEQGIHPDYISMQNEPDMEATYAATLFDATENYVDYTGKKFDRAGYDKALPIFVAKIKELNEVPKILGPEVLGIGYGNTQKYMDALDASLLDGLAFHYYHSGEEAADRYAKPNAYINAQKELATKYGNMPQLVKRPTNGSSLASPRAALRIPMSMRRTATMSTQHGSSPTVSTTTASAHICIGTYCGEHQTRMVVSQ